MSFNVILLLSAIVHYDIFLNEMIFSLICINSQPISHVINVYYETQMMILKWTEYNIRVINYYFYILFFSPQRVEERWRESCVTMHCEEVHVTVFCDMWINAVWIYQSVVPLCFCFKPPWHFWCAFLQPLLAWPSEVAGIIPSITGTITDQVIVTLLAPNVGLEKTKL